MTVFTSVASACDDAGTKDYGYGQAEQERYEEMNQQGSKGLEIEKGTKNLQLDKGMKGLQLEKGSKNLQLDKGMKGLQLNK